MRREDIKPCSLCGQGLGHDNCLTFYEITVGNRVLDPMAIQRHSGLEQMLGSPELARVMGPDADSLVLEPFTDARLLVCLECVVSREIGSLVEAAEPQMEPKNPALEEALGDG